MRTIISIILILFAMTAKSQPAGEKMKSALQLQSEKEYVKSNKILIDLYSSNDFKELVCLNLAKNYVELGNYKLADKYSGECLAIKGEYSKDAAVIKGRMLDYQGKLDEEEKLYREILARYPKDYTINLLLAALIDDMPNRKNEAGRIFYKTIKCEPLNQGAHYVIAINEEKARHYVQSLLANYFQLLTNPKPTTVLKIQTIMKNTRKVTDAMQEVIYSTDTTASETDTQLYWAMAFLPELEKCESDEDTQMDDPECFIENSIAILEKVCESVTVNQNEEERTASDFYVDFFSNVLKNNMIEEYLFYALMNTYKDLYYYIPGISKERMNKFADFLEEYFK